MCRLVLGSDMALTPASVNSQLNGPVLSGLPEDNQYSLQARDEWYQGNMPEHTSLTTLGAKITGGRTSAQYQQDANNWIRDRSASLSDRDWQAQREDTAFQRKVQDYLAAGFSPLAALEGSTGGQSAAQAMIPKSSRGASNGSISLAPLLMLLGIFGKAALASNTAMSAVAAKNSTAMELAATKAASAKDIAQMKEAGQDARLAMRMETAKDVQHSKEVAAEYRQIQDQMFKSKMASWKEKRVKVKKRYNSRGQSLGYEEDFSYPGDGSPDF